MSGYTTESMMAKAHEQFLVADKALERATNPRDSAIAARAMNAQAAMAAAQAGLLAVELARYADGNGWPERTEDY